MELEVDSGKKRKRLSSGGSVLTSQQVAASLDHYGEVVLQCTINITYGIRELGNAIVLKYVCGLLNSGGGILHMLNQDAQRGTVLSKHLDTWWSGMEVKMAEMLSRDDICNYFDLVGNHDDPDLFLFVKTAEHLCTLKYHCRLPTDTATHEVTYQSMLQLLVNVGEPGSLDDLPSVPSRYIFRHSAEELKKETKQIQFKQLTVPQSKSKDKRNLPEKICSMMIKYVSAFANHEGGHIYFGIDDARASVVGEELDLSDQRKTEILITNRMRTIIWRNPLVHAERGKHWDLQFFPVENFPRKGHRVVVVVSVCKFPGGVFTSTPVSTHVDLSTGRLAEFSFEEWTDAILNPLRDVPELHTRFIKLSLLVPQAPLVFSLPNTIDSIKTKVLLKGKGKILPRHYIDSYTQAASHREAIQQLLNHIASEQSICIGLECWGLKIPMEIRDGVICDVAIVTQDDGIHVVTFSTSSLPHVYQHSKTAATILKNKLVKNGGCTEKFSVMSHMCDVSGNHDLPNLERDFSSRSIYPSHFCVSGERKFQRILNSLVVCMASYRARSQVRPGMNQHGGYHFLLTHDQFELLLTQQFTRELWVHGPAGAGKTVAALQMVQELRRRGCRHDNILYLVENDKLADFVRSHSLCLVTTRRALLIDMENHDLMLHKYGSICNVLVDEVQNFKDRDGDWFSLAEKLANQKPENSIPRCCNFYWLFMDYTQKVHKFKAGLPAVIGKNNFMLSEVSRSTKEIFDFTSRLMMASDNVDGLCSPTMLQTVNSTPVLAHNFSSGKGVDILSCRDAEIKNILTQVLSGLMKNGVRGNDIAILVGRRDELDRLRSTLQDVSLEKRGQTDCSTPPGVIGLPSKSSVEEHLRECGSDSQLSIKPGARLPRSKTSEKRDKFDTNANTEYRSDEERSDDEDEEENLPLEINNPFDVLSSCSSSGQIANQGGDVTMDTEAAQKPEVTFYGDDTDSMDQHSDRSVSADRENQAFADVTTESGVAMNTVKQFSGLDKAAVIGINPRVNEEHADFNKFVLSLATRARDNLVIITTSDDVKQQLDHYASVPAQ